MQDHLFEQVMLIGEGRPYLSAIAVLAASEWKKIAVGIGLDPGAAGALQAKEAEKAVLSRIGERMSQFPGYAQIRRATLTLEPWTVDNGMLTPTMKLKRAKVMEKFYAELDAMYAGH